MGGSEKDFALEVFVFSQDFWDGIHNEHVQLSYCWGVRCGGGYFVIVGGWCIFIEKNDNEGERLLGA